MSTSRPSPAFVTQRAARRLPRLALWLFCAAWAAPGVVGRDPWRNEDLAAFGVMSALAEGRTDWFTPTLGGVPVTAEPLAHWIGALAIMALSPWVDPAVAARLPFAALLLVTLVLTWYATFHLARTDAAQPVALAFGGQAQVVDYARALADGAVLALIATLGLLQLGHETTPELAQLAAAAAFLWALAAAPFRPRAAPLAALLALPALSLAGAPVVALLLGLAGLVLCMRSQFDQARRLVTPLLLSAALGAAAASALGVWAWKLGLQPDLEQVLQVVRQWVWFLWPLWPLAAWTLWSWRRQGGRRHVAVPLVLAAVPAAASVAMGGDDRALMQCLPALAVLAAFALPTLRRAVSAAIDWFSVSFLSLSALLIWGMYIAMQTGRPEQWAANIAKLAPGFMPSFSAVPLVFAVAGTLAWCWLVRWRTARHTEALWKSLVLPAGGVALCWLLLMTLWLPLLDHARSPRAWLERSARWIGSPQCVAAPGVSPSLAAGLEVFGRYRVDAREDAALRSGCEVLLAVGRVERSPDIAGWTLLGAERRARERTELLSVYRRSP
jgi:4-amino-4-deoxy-L-arabinose transferase-like glycosyltransferase